MSSALGYWRRTASAGWTAHAPSIPQGSDHGGWHASPFAFKNKSRAAEFLRRVSGRTRWCRCRVRRCSAMARSARWKGRSNQAGGSAPRRCARGPGGRSGPVYSRMRLHSGPPCGAGIGRPSKAGADPGPGSAPAPEARRRPRWRRSRYRPCRPRASPAADTRAVGCCRPASSHRYRVLWGHA
jgi:hypothetical protein